MNTLIERLISKIKQKKELAGVSDETVNEVLVKLFKREPKLFKELSIKFNEKSAAYTKTIKLARAKLRRSYGLFRVEKVEDDFKNVEKVLSSHSSTKERTSFYSELYPQLFSITGKPAVILDLGCGVNPFSVEVMKLKMLKYYAYDISEKEVELLNLFFAWKHSSDERFVGKAEVLDASKIELVRKLPAADVCFMFKLTDILDRGKGHKKTEEVMKAVPSKWLVISFPTLTMSGKKMTAPHRNWMEWLCQRLGYEFKVLNFPNEIFYVVRKGEL
jgi:16S rRNA (guanine(1405)-N(7))-methyltransferase